MIIGGKCLNIGKELLKFFNVDIKAKYTYRRDSIDKKQVL